MAVTDGGRDTKRNRKCDAKLAGRSEPVNRLRDPASKEPRGRARHPTNAS